MPSFGDSVALMPTEAQNKINSTKFGENLSTEWRCPKTLRYLTMYSVSSTIVSLLGSLKWPHFLTSQDSFSTKYMFPVLSLCLFCTSLRFLLNKVCPLCLWVMQVLEKQRWWKRKSEQQINIFIQLVKCPWIFSATHFRCKHSWSEDWLKNLLRFWVHKD